MRRKYLLRMALSTASFLLTPVVIMIVPLLIGDAGTYSHRTAHRIVEMEARRVGFDTIDLTDAFMHAGKGNLKPNLETLSTRIGAGMPLWPTC